MKIAFIHDHPFCEKNGAIYSTSSLPASAWDRYLINNDSLYVFGRQSKVGGKSLSSRSGVYFQLSETYHSPLDILINYQKVKKELYGFVKNMDCVILRVPSILGLLGCKIAKDLNKPYLLEVVADAYDSYRHYGNIMGILFARVYDKWTKNVVKRSSYTLYVTQNYLQKRYPNEGKQLACTNAVINPVDQIVLEKRIEKIKNKDAKRIVCGEIGDVSVRFKGCHIMLEAMKILKDEGLIVDFHIVGGGNPQKMQALAKELGVETNFFFDGFVSHDKVTEFYDNIDIYVHPSYQEGLPRVVVEAISRGCPCAVSSVAGTPELVEDKYLHTPGDAMKLASDIKKLIEQDECIRVANVNFNHAKEYYSDLLNARRKEFYAEFFKTVKR